MRYKVEFQYRPKDNARPLDYVQEFDMSGDDHTFQPIPNISDQVHIEVFEADSSRGLLVVEIACFLMSESPMTLIVPLTSCSLTAMSIRASW
jgi:hypothetical protein